MKHKQVSGMFETSLCHFDIYFFRCITIAGLAQLLECLTAERKVVGLIPGAGPILRVLK